MTKGNLVQNYASIPLIFVFLLDLPAPCFQVSVLLFFHSFQYFLSFNNSLLFYFIAASKTMQYCGVQ